MVSLCSAWTTVVSSHAAISNRKNRVRFMESTYADGFDIGVLIVVDSEI